jgi:hypothetical protein
MNIMTTFQLHFLDNSLGEIWDIAVAKKPIKDTNAIAPAIILSCGGAPPPSNNVTLTRRAETHDNNATAFINIL